MSLKSQKAAIRGTALAARDRLSVETRIEASLAIAQIGAQAIDVAAGDIVSGFFPIRSEVDARPLMFALREKGARLCLPVVVDRITIVFRELLRGADLIDTGFGTIGPGPEAAVLEPDMMLVPLAAFDRSGARLGYGAGHYDRAIARLCAAGRSPHLVGVAFDVQRVDRVPNETHDVPLSAILTESGLHQTTTDGS